MSLLLAALLAFAGVNAGILAELQCKDSTTNWGQLCFRNGTIVRWFSSIALFIIVAVGAYRYVTGQLVA